jgi:hypothetical protein
MLTSELDVLKPIDPSISHPDDYEIFTLSNAQVVYQSNGMCRVASHEAAGGIRETRSAGSTLSKLC